MTINGNGKRKKNDAEAPLSTTEQPTPNHIPNLAKTTEDLENLFKEEKAATPLEQPRQGDIKTLEPESNTTDPEASSPTAEELLKAAKAATKEAPQPQEKVEEQGGSKSIATQTSTSAITQATGEAAQALVQASEQAEEAQFEIGAREALRDAQRIRQGYQATLLVEMAKNKLEDTLELAEQLNALRQHTDQSTADATSKIIEKLRGQAKKAIAPLDLSPKASKLKII